MNSIEASYLVAIEDYLSTDLGIPFVEGGSYVDPKVVLGQAAIHSVQIFEPRDLMRTNLTLGLDLALAVGSTVSAKEAMLLALDYNADLIRSMRKLCLSGVSGTYRGNDLVGAWRGAKPVSSAEIRVRLNEEPPAIGLDYNEVFVFQSWQCLAEFLHQSL